MTDNLLERIADGRTDLVFDYVAQGHPAKSADRAGTPLIDWCAYYGDVSGIRFLLANGETLRSPRRRISASTARRSTDTGSCASS